MRRPAFALLVALLIGVAAAAGFVVGRMSDDTPQSQLTPVRTGTVWVCGDRDDANGSCRSYTPIPITSYGTAQRRPGSD